jgi:hypothetical protein
MVLLENQLVSALDGIAVVALRVRKVEVAVLRAAVGVVHSVQVEFVVVIGL